MYSKILKQEIALSEKTGAVFCADGVKYSPVELDVFEKNGATVDERVHCVKKIIGGEIVGFMENTKKVEKSR
jgi:hypothetical protein